MSTWLHDIERASIDRFVRQSEFAFREQRVLDYGCGAQPYREIVELAGGEYTGFDRKAFPANVGGEDHGPDLDLVVDAFDTILCTQVIQYVDDPISLLDRLQLIAKPGGVLLITGPTNWPVVEGEDKWRLTLTGIKSLLSESGWGVQAAKYRASFAHERIDFPLGWAVEAVA